ncbi:hypothetical protein ACFQ07_27585 [Actinomadura adrarensis]|uniref:DUF397 domain-containing protein n=1 Tax=Actinomadura adrarensis TaxID=1819600 RepID=A0ABW3CNC7_9ACTN
MDGEERDLVNPRIVGKEEAFQALPDDEPRPPKLLRITGFLRMDLAAR